MSGVYPSSRLLNAGIGAQSVFFFNYLFFNMALYHAFKAGCTSLCSVDLYDDNLGMICTVCAHVI